MKQFVFRWAATTIAVMVASSIIRGDPLRHCRGAHRGITFAGYSQRLCPAVSIDPQCTKRTLAASGTQCRCRISCR